jgi:hypothetical protein
MPNHRAGDYTKCLGCSGQAQFLKLNFLLKQFSAVKSELTIRIYIFILQVHHIKKIMTGIQ